MAKAPKVTDGRDQKATEIGLRIIQARQELGGMKQEELADLIGVSTRSMQAYESGEVVPYRKMRDLERILQRPMAWILHGDEAVVGQDEQLTRIEAKLDHLTQLLEGMTPPTRSRKR